MSSQSTPPAQMPTTAVEALHPDVEFTLPSGEPTSTTVDPITKNKKIFTEGGGKKSGGRGQCTRRGAFTAREGVSLAKAWVRQSMRVQD